MSATVANPPVIDGYTFRERIGRGGFADVHLYDQVMPRRQVAVKVLLDAAGERERQLFDAEANVMAQLSGHASIVPIYQAGVSGDGRPFLVMEYCPPPNLSVRYRTAALPVPEVLETMIKVAGAVETAHRAGILHRDIKPANILTNAYGAPKLTDFGIAHATSGEHEAVAGMSVPWAAPETFAEAPALDVRTDVWSLAATTWTLLAGRTPFEVPGGANDNATLMARIEGKAPTPISRADVPATLVGALTRAMSKRVEYRPASALAFARSLQEVQIELALAPTQIEVLDAGPVHEVEQVSDERTSVRPVAVIVPEAFAERGTAIRPIAVVSPDEAHHTALRDDHTVLRSAPPAVVPALDSDTVSRAALAGDASTGFTPTTSSAVDPGAADSAPDRQVLRPPTAMAAATPRSRAGLLAAAAGVSLVGCLVAVAVFVGKPAEEEGPTKLDGPRQGSDDVAIAAAPAPVTDVLVERHDQQVLVTWKAPDAEPGDVYQWSWTGNNQEPTFESVADTRVELPVPPGGGPACVVVRVLRGSTLSDPSPIRCVTL